MARRSQPSQPQGELFGSELFPVRRPVETSRPIDLSLRVKTAMGQALKACPDSAMIVAARISEMTGRELTTDALYAYTAPGKPDHDIGITRFIAFARATGALWLWDVLVEDDGLTVLEGRDAKLAQVGHLQQQRMLLDAELARLSRELGREDPRPPSRVRRPSR
jgi:hypothetical protein